MREVKRRKVAAVAHCLVIPGTEAVDDLVVTHQWLRHWRPNLTYLNGRLRSARIDGARIDTVLARKFSLAALWLNVEGRNMTHVAQQSHPMVIVPSNCNFSH